VGAIAYAGCLDSWRSLYRSYEIM